MQSDSQIEAVTTVPAELSAVDTPSAITDGSTVEYIPLNRLVKSPYNQRKTERDPAIIQSYAVNIKAVSLLQNLVVHHMKKAAKKAATFGVAAGESRRLALELLVEWGDIPADYPVPCKVVPVAEAILISAAENDVRTPPHPADQCTAYQALVESGKSAEFIAAVFKTHPKSVARRLKLARVSPKLFDLFREDKISIEQMQALALSDEHETQERVWFGATVSWQRSPDQLRAVLTKDEISANGNRLAQFVGLDVFEQAGGHVRRDLFSDRGQGWFTDMELMTRLAQEKLQALAPEHGAGWKWVEARINFPHDEQSQFSRIYPGQRDFTEDEAAALDRIRTRIDEIEAKQESEELSEEENDALEEEWARLEAEQEQIGERAFTFDDQQKAHAGVVVMLGHTGVEALCGLVRAEDEQSLRAVMQESGNTDAAEHLVRASSHRSQPPRVKSAHSEKLLLNLTAHRTAAVRSALSQNPQIALVTLTHKLALEYLCKGYGLDNLSAAQISSRDAVFRINSSAPEVADADHAAGLEAYVESWQHLMPKDRNALFAWLLEQPQERLLSLLALCTALSINGVARSEDPNAINAVAGALNLDLSAYWQPTRASYFDHVSKARIVAIVSEVVSKEEGARLAKMKKGEASDAAEKLLAGKNWLPEFMADPQVAQVMTYDDEDDDADEDGTVDESGVLADAARDDADQPEDRSVTDAVENEHEASESPVETGESVRRPVAAAWPFPTSTLHSHSALHAA